ncbi:hypothetical protein Agub_g12403, partial [Astrephomene gubernaculifera]
LRFVESTCVLRPLIVADPLAGVLAGERGLALARQELEQLTLSQGPGRHLRVPARSRLIDDWLEREIAALKCGPATACQVVSLGAGMCTRPWRLAALSGCHVFEVDLPHVASTKAKLLALAGAQTTQIEPLGSPRLPSPQQQPQLQQPQASLEPLEPQKPVFPLMAATYACVGVDLAACCSGGNGNPDGGSGCGGADSGSGCGETNHSDGSNASSNSSSSLAAALIAQGFDPALPTLWVLEALLYYMPLAAASDLLVQLIEVSEPRSRLVATCVDRELLEASRRGVPKGHVFADLWHFDAGELLYGTEAFAGQHWQVDWRETERMEGSQQQGQEEQQEGQQVQQQGTVAGAGDSQGDQQQQRPAKRLPRSTRQLALERLGADTYVALYGGSELLFVAGVRQKQ